METIEKDVTWGKVRVRPRFEKVVSRNLQAKGYEEFLPIYRRKTRWSDRTKELELPLFPGYTFCKFDATQRLPILMIPGVNSVVGIGKIPMPIDEHEINDVRAVVESGTHFEPWPFLQVGQTVRVENGPLTGTEGLVARVKDSYRLVISVNLLQRSVAVEIDRDCLKPVSEPTRNIALAR